MIQIDNEFGFGDRVYIKTDPDQCEHIICEIKTTRQGEIMYLVTFYNASSWHYEFEITSEPDILTKTGATRKK